MEKIFLVEDEVVVREGIKNNVDWAGHGYDFCGEARDGELALPLIRKHRPDIVISDIKMPFMDGLELSKLIKKELPQTEIILLTGYEEFSYARQAIQIGISQYLTKPISGDDLLAEVDKVAAKIREKKSEEALREKYTQEMAENSRREQKSLFEKLVTGGKSASELVELSKEKDIDILAVWYNIILFHGQDVKQNQEEYSGRYVDFEQHVLDVCADQDIIVFERDLDGKAFLFKADTEEELIEKQNRFKNAVVDLAANYSDIRYFGGLGDRVNRLTNLPESFASGRRAFARRFFVEENMIAESQDLVTGANRETDDFNINDIDINQVRKVSVDEFLKTGNREEVSFFVDEFLSTAGGSFFDSLIFRQYVVMDIYIGVCAFVESLSHSRSEIDQLDVSSTVIRNVTESKNFIIKVMEQAISIRESQVSNKYGEIVDSAISYIKEHYSEDDLSLNSLSSYVNMSPNRLSMIFSQETGQTFIKYLTDYRMSKAKELLRCTRKRSSEVSIDVGYRDPHYFSYLFKKSVGVTPTQYRGNNE